MTHLLLFYKIIFYTLGFFILGFTIYKYIKTKNGIVGSFLFLWSSMTATAATYVMNYYYIINFDLNKSFIGFKLQSIFICLIGIAILNFVYRIFKIKSKVIITVVVIIAGLLILSVFVPLEQLKNPIYRYRIMIFITLANIYSYIISFRKIMYLKDKSDKRLGLIFMFSFILFFGFLYIIDINAPEVIPYKGFLFFPLFYIFIGVFCTYIGVKKLDLNSSRTTGSLDDFISKYNLTKREAEIALLLADGYTYKKIAESLFISQGTVSTHVMHIYEKTGTSSKIQLNKEISKFKA